MLNQNGTQYLALSRATVALNLLRGSMSVQDSGKHECKTPAVANSSGCSCRKISRGILQLGAMGILVLKLKLGCTRIAFPRRALLRPQCYSEGHWVLSRGYRVQKFSG